jgi:hypothetical protein
MDGQRVNRESVDDGGITITQYPKGGKGHLEHLQLSEKRMPIEIKHPDSRIACRLWLLARISRLEDRKKELSLQLRPAKH